MNQRATFSGRLQRGLQQRLSTDVGEQDATGVTPQFKKDVGRQSVVISFGESGPLFQPQEGEGEVQLRLQGIAEGF